MAAGTPLDELAAAALLGSERRPPQMPAVEGDRMLAGALAAQPWAEDPAAALLAAAAMLTAHARAGRLAPILTVTHPEPAAEESAPLGPPAALALLETLLPEAADEPLLLEWLQRTAARGERVPELLLPALLDRARDRPALRVGLLSAGGERLGWLAAQNPEWAWATPTGRDAPERAWEIAAQDTRQLLLAEIRRTDPARGRALIEATWEADPAPERARFLELLAEGLSPADEPLLERALRDRRREVRAAAAQLLSGLTGSRYQQAAWTQVAELITVEGRLRRHLSVALPPEPGTGDAVEALPGVEVAGLGRRGAQLATLIAATDLSAWEAHLGVTPEEAVTLAQGSEHAGAVAAGWRAAIARQRRPDWAAALAVALADPRPLAAVPVAEVERAALKLLGTVPEREIARTLNMLNGPWTPAISTRVVELLADVPAWGVDLRDVGLHLHPDVYDRARTQLGERRGAETLLHILDLRHALTRELPTP